MAPSLEKKFVMRLYRSEVDTLILPGARGSEVRAIAPYKSGFLHSASGSSSGSAIDASLLQGGSNCLRVDMKAQPAPTTYLDARVHFRDQALGASFHVRFEGVARLDEHLQKILDASPDARTTEAKEHYEFNNPIFEVSREEDRWMESTAWVGHGHYVVERQGEAMDVAVEFEIYQLVSS